MPIESNFPPAEEFRRALKKLAQDFYNSTGVRVVSVELAWNESMGGAASLVRIESKLES